MKTFSLTTNLCWWLEVKLGIGLSINYIPPQMGYEPFIICQFLCFMFFIAPKAEDYGWTWDESIGRPVRVKGTGE